MKWIITKEQEGIFIRDYLREVRGLSRRLIKAIKFNGGSLLVNGELSTVRRKLIEGDELEVILPPEERGSYMKPEKLPLDIVYEDDDVLVINKPSGVATIPSFNHVSGTIANRILGYYDEHKLDYTVHIVTRLDRDTSGLMLVAKHRYSHSILSNDQKQGLVNRRYYAIIEGKLGNKNGVVDLPIARETDSIIKRRVHDDGQRAITRYEVEKEIGETTLLDIKLETGRTHQIRVHFSHLGHPLIGDDLYGGDMTVMKRQALHCRLLSFIQPTTKERINLSSELPEDMKQYFMQKSSSL
ncbi:RluA family pseudouridine synthase [Aquibacillus albus]|uniref:Pseudouridine synthase n=1 Tax=Aquibacillus albus TaxID=1168171 RepID=A0ABS2N081_9BACI|nr:RluA family pseudouridine synthase [Aquibacillus albus]MBM7571547.1 23S rRNA pseudouridine1911/1915/1917 synthase [Aquibacillus albus]